MFNPLAAVKVAQDIFAKDPGKLKELADKSDTDLEGVRKEIFSVAAEHGLKLTDGSLKLALKAAKPFLSKLNATSKAAAEKLIEKLT